MAYKLKMQILFVFLFPFLAIASGPPQIFTQPIAKEWPKRRQELIGLFQDHVYGRSPPPLKASFKIDSKKVALNGKAQRIEAQIKLSNKKKSVVFHLLLYTPLSSKGPSPVFLGLNFAGNHTLHSDPGITINSSTKGFPRGYRASSWAVEKILDSGYAVASIYYGDIDPDFDDGFKNGVHALFPEWQKGEHNFASISAWAYGLSLALDFLQTQPSVDAKKVALIGHSRLGKTALWAGALDQRFAMVISNNSGQGGAKLSRHVGGESIQEINQRFPHWFCRKYKSYNGHPEKLPVDQHMLIALIAPRPVYVASASEDHWADPQGEFAAVKLAHEVYELLGTEGLPIKEFPAPQSSSMGQMGYHLRQGKHGVEDYDWQQFIRFADKHFKEKK